MTVPLILPNRYTDPMKKFISSTLGLLVVLACLMAYSTSAQAGTKNRPGPPRSTGFHAATTPGNAGSC